MTTLRQVPGPKDGARAAAGFPAGCARTASASQCHRQTGQEDGAHVTNVTTHPPKTGGQGGDSEKIMLTNASSLAAAAPQSNRGHGGVDTTVNRMPCATRNAGQPSDARESAHPSAARANAERAMRITRLRPKVSGQRTCIRLMQERRASNRST